MIEVKNFYYRNSDYDNKEYRRLDSVEYQGLNSQQKSRIEHELLNRGYELHYEISNGGHVLPRVLPDNYPLTGTGRLASPGYIKKISNGDLKEEWSFVIMHFDKRGLESYIKDMFDICEDIRRSEIEESK